MKETEESCQELIDDILDISSDLLAKLKQISQSDGKERLKDFEKELKEYHRLEPLVI